MMAKSLRVGLIGASLERGWATISHVPALAKLAGFELAGVIARDTGRADALAKAVGAERGFADVGELVRDAAIDLIAISVRVPHHREYVLQALSAGKHVYCEWPLGLSVAEAEEMRDAAASAGVHVAIGLQARMNPALRRAREFIASGKIGRVLSATMFSGTVAFGRKTTAADFYLEYEVNGATLLTIHVGHAMDATVAVLGGIADVAALASTQYPEIEIEEPDRTHRRSIADHLLACARLDRGGVVSVEVAGGRPLDCTFRFEVVGDRGSLVLDGAAPRGFQSGRLTLSLDGNPQFVDEGEFAQLPDAAFNVGAMYAALRDDIANGTAVAPDFDHAVRLTRLIRDLSDTGRTGCRVEANRWPTD